MNELNEQKLTQVNGNPLESPKPSKTDTVTVNNNDVTFDDHKATGLQIKQTAIAQEPNFKPKCNAISLNVVEG